MSSFVDMQIQNNKHKFDRLALIQWLTDRYSSALFDVKQSMLTQCSSEYTLFFYLYFALHALNIVSCIISCYCKVKILNMYMYVYVKIYLLLCFTIINSVFLGFLDVFKLFSFHLHSTRPHWDSSWLSVGVCWFVPAESTWECIRCWWVCSISYTHTNTDL